MYFWLSCLAAGLSLCLALWVVLRPLRLHDDMAGPRSYRLPMKMVWPWVSALVPVCSPFVSWRLRRRLDQLINVAGLNPEWRADHIVALQCLLFLTFAVSSFVVATWYLATSLMHGLAIASLAGAAAMWWPRRWIHEQGARRQRQMLKDFPFLLDMATLCVEAGLNLQGALQQAAHHGPEGALRQELRHALADMRAGMPRLEALHDMAARTGLAAVQTLVTALGQADQLGMSLGPLLRAQSEQRRAERFLKAEKLALEAPVKMLFPMVFCIFPCTFLIIGFPIAVKVMEMTA